MLLFGDVARRQRSPVKVSHTKRGHSARWGAHGAYLAREGAQRPVKASCPGTNDTRRVFGESRTYSRVLLRQARCVSRRSGPHLLRVGIRPACARYGPLTMSGSPDRSRRFEKTQRSQLSEQCEPCSQESARVGHRAPEAPVAGLLWRPIRSAGVICTPHPERLRDRRSNEEGSPRATGWPRNERGPRGADCAAAHWRRRTSGASCPSGRSSGAGPFPVPLNPSAGTSVGDDALMTLRELSAYSRLSLRTLQRHVAGLTRWRLPPYRVGGKILVRRSEFDGWLEQWRRDALELQLRVGPTRLRRSATVPS